MRRPAAPHGSPAHEELVIVSADESFDASESSGCGDLCVYPAGLTRNSRSDLPMDVA